MLTSYELGLVLSPLLTDAEREEILASLRSFITSQGGAISLEDVWGVRDMAYAIRRHDKGFYTFWYFTLPATAVAELRRQLRLNASVLRFLFMKHDAKNAPVKYEGNVGKKPVREEETTEAAATEGSDKVSAIESAITNA